MQEREIYKAFGQAVAQKRAGQKTQVELARAVGMSRASLANIERGEQRVYIHQLLAITQALGVELSDLVPDKAHVSPLPRAKVSVSGDRVNRSQERAIKELVSSITTSSRKLAP